MSEFDKFNEWSASTIADLFLRWKEISEKCEASHKSVHRETLGQLAERLRELHVVHQRTCHLLALCQNADTVAAQADIIALLVRENESLRRTVASRSKHVNRLRSALDDARKRLGSSTASQTNANVQKALEPVVPGDREIWWPECFGGSTWTWPDGSHIVKQAAEDDEFCVWTPKELQTDDRGNPLVFETKEKAAKALLDLQCGPWHTRPVSGDDHPTWRDFEPLSPLPDVRIMDKAELDEVLDHVARSVDAAENESLKAASESLQAAIQAGKRFDHDRPQPMLKMSPPLPPFEDFLVTAGALVLIALILLGLVSVCEWINRL